MVVSFGCLIPVQSHLGGFVAVMVPVWVTLDLLAAAMSSCKGGAGAPPLPHCGRLPLASSGGTGIATNWSGPWTLTWIGTLPAGDSKDGQTIPRGERRLNWIVL